MEIAGYWIGQEACERISNVLLIGCDLHNVVGCVAKELPVLL